MGEVGQRRKKIIDLGIILLIGLISTTWFRGDFLINHGDQAYPLSPLHDFKNSTLQYWNRLLVTGFPQTGNFANLFYHLFSLLTLFGIPLIVTEKLLYYFIFTFAGVFIYLLVDSLKVKNSRLIGITAGLAYMFNFYPLFSFWNSFINLAFFYTSAPLLLALYIKLLESNKIKYFLWWLFISIAIFSPAATNPGHVVTLFLIHLTYLLFFLFFSSPKEKRKKFITLSFVLLLFWLLLNTWWLLPTFSNLNQSLVGSGATTTSGSAGILEDMSLFTSFINLFRFFGPWTFYFQVFGDPYFPWSEIYFTWPFIFLSFLGPIMVVLGFLLKRKKPVVLYFTLLFILGLFLMKGVHPPFGIINRFIVLKIPFFVVFRNSYEKFGVMTLLGYSLLVGFGFAFLNQALKKVLKQKLLRFFLISLSCFLMFGLYMWPFWTGDLIYEGGKVTPGARVKIPDYYFKARDWLEREKEEFKILSLPKQDGAAYRWMYGYSGSDDPAIRLLQRPIVSPFDPKDEILLPFLDQLYRIFSQAETCFQQSQLHFLSVANIKYVLLHQDLAWPVNVVRPDVGVENLERILESNVGLKKIKSFGKLDFYKLDDKYFLPHFYIPEKIVYLQGNVSNLVDITSLDDFPLKSAVSWATQQTSQIKKESLFKPDEIFVAKPDINQVFLKSSQFNPATRNYELEVPTKGDYLLFISQPMDLAWESLNDWQVGIEAEKLKPQDFNQRRTGWLEWGPLFLPEGETKVNISFGHIPNLISSENWQPYLQGNLQPKEIAFYKVVDSWQPDSWYHISGFFQTGNQPVKLVLIEEITDFWSNEKPSQKTVISKEIILPADKNNQLEFNFKSKFNSLSAKLVLVGEPHFLEEDLLPVRVENLKVLPLWEPEIVLRSYNTPSGVEGQTPKITFVQISPTKYRVKIEKAKDAYMLVFSETFHQGWKMYLASEQRGFLPFFFAKWGNKPKADDRHFLVNGYANSWYLTPEDAGRRENYELVVEFTPQRFFYAGVLISGLTLLAGCLYLLHKKLKYGKI